MFAGDLQVLGIEAGILQSTFWAAILGYFWPFRQLFLPCSTQRDRRFKVDIDRSGRAVLLAVPRRCSKQLVNNGHKQSGIHVI